MMRVRKWNRGAVWGKWESSRGLGGREVVSWVLGMKEGRKEGRIIGMYKEDGVMET